MGIYDKLSQLNKRPSPKSVPTPKPPDKDRKKVQKPATVTPRHRDTTTPRQHDTIYDAMIEAIRQEVKQVGKEAATYRFTVEEKKSLAKLVFSYRSQGIRTSENEVTRIALNYLMNDFKQRSKKSILHQALLVLHE